MNLRTAVYVMSQPAHLPYLAVSLMTLRRHYDGNVFVYAWPESWDIVSRMARDERLGIDAVAWDHHRRGRNSQFESKQLAMMNLDPSWAALYLDADTSVHGNLSPLFEQIEGGANFVATQFCGWKTTGGIPSNRVGRLRKFPEIDQALVGEVLANPWPSVNGGVFACRSDSPVLPLWHEWTNVARSVYISDESVLHVLLPKFTRSGDMVIAAGGMWNCSPMRFQPRHLKDGDVVIRHFHGDSNCRRNKSEKGVSLWWPLYRRAMDLDLGGIRSWRPGVGNKYLDKCEREMEAGHG